MSNLADGYVLIKYSVPRNWYYIPGSHCKVYRALYLGRSEKRFFFHPGGARCVVEFNAERACSHIDCDDEINQHSKKLRLYIRDNFKCWRCNKYLSYAQATLDHIIPKSKNGSDSIDNLIIACRPCNSERGNKYVNIPGRPGKLKNTYGLIDQYGFTTL